MLVSIKSVLSFGKICFYSLLLFENGKEKAQHFNAYKTKYYLCFIAFQLLFPFRYLCYPNELFWTEEGSDSLGVLC
jgi:hypothetical protein